MVCSERNLSRKTEKMFVCILQTFCEIEWSKKFAKYFTKNSHFAKAFSRKPRALKLYLVFFAFFASEWNAKNYKFLWKMRNFRETKFSFHCKSWLMVLESNLYLVLPEWTLLLFLKRIRLFFFSPVFNSYFWLFMIINGFCHVTKIFHYFV